MSLLIASFVISLINAYLPKISRRVSFLFVKQRVNNELKNEIDETLAEMKTISIRHEFPKYARLKRKLTKLTDDKKNYEKAHLAECTKVTLKVSYFFQGLMTLISLGMFWFFRYQSVIKFPEEWLYPLENVVSWPMQAAGNISFPVWFLITNSVSKIIAGSFVL